MRFRVQAPVWDPRHDKLDAVVVLGCGTSGFFQKDCLVAWTFGLFSRIITTYGVKLADLGYRNVRVRPPNASFRCGGSILLQLLLLKAKLVAKGDDGSVGHVSRFITFCMNLKVQVLELDEPV